MSLGLKVGTENLIELGQIKEELICLLERNNINYKIMFDKVDTSKNIRETIISIPELDVEVSLENDFVSYIKSKATRFSKLTSIDSKLSDIEKIECITSSIKEYFKINNVSIHDINTSNLDLRVIINEEDNSCKYRIHIMTTQKGESFIYTMKLI